jgi:hypothetical protein
MIGSGQVDGSTLFAATALVSADNREHRWFIKSLADIFSGA